MDEERGKRRPQRAGGVASDDIELATWLLQLWAHGTPPSRIEVWQLFGKRRPARGEMIFHRDFKLDKLGPEECNRLSNEIYAVAQNDVDVSQTAAVFQIAVIDKDRKSAPLTRRLGPIEVARTYSTALARRRSGGDDDDDDDDDDDVDGKALNYKYIKQLLAELRWDKERSDKVIGGVLGLLKDSNEAKQKTIDDLLGRHMEFFNAAEQARDLSLDRELKRNWNKLKVDLAHDGVRTMRNIFPRLIADAPQGGRVDKVAKVLGMSPERTCVDNFIRDCEKTGISEQLFGELEKRDDKIVAVAGKEGIFSPEQLLVLLKVRSGQLSPDALDDLMPWSNSDLAITDAQTQAATPLMTKGTVEALFQLVDLRKKAARAREENETKNETKKKETT